MQTEKQTTKNAKKAKSFYAVAVKYARDVCDDKIVAGKYVKLACNRFLNDLDSGKWDFDKDAVERACKFLQALPHIKGSRGTLVLQPWQVWFVASVVGFKDKVTGLRRFSRVIAFVARGNGKSFLCSGLALYFSFFDGEKGADVYSLATTREQARIVWATSQAMMRALPELTSKFGIEVGQHSITQQSSNSSFKALSSDFNTLDGLSPYVAVIDELHAVDRGLWDIIETAMQKRQQPLLISISTAGFDTSSVGFEISSYIRSILDGVREDDRMFGVIYEADDDDVLDEDNWNKANPNLGVSVQLEAMRADAKKASTLSSFRNAFITRHLDRWVNAREAWMRMDKWLQCASNRLVLEDYVGRPCVIGLDMSNRNDITSKCYLFTEQRDGQLHYSAFWKNYLPEVAVQESRNASYAGWVADGHITTTPGDSIDYAQVQEELIEDSQKFPQMEVASDPWNTVQLSQNIANYGIQTIEMRPTIKNFSPAMKELQDAVLSGRFHHDGNPAVAWAVGNITVKPDAAGNIYPAKPHGNSKIDPGVALIMAIARAMVNQPNTSPLVVRWM
jgi:phage terminase large subunit-like protein